MDIHNFQPLNCLKTCCKILLKFKSLSLHCSSTKLKFYGHAIRSGVCLWKRYSMSMYHTGNAQNTLMIARRNTDINDKKKYKLASKEKKTFKKFWIKTLLLHSGHKAIEKQLNLSFANRVQTSNNSIYNFKKYTHRDTAALQQSAAAQLYAAAFCFMPCRCNTSKYAACSIYAANSVWSYATMTSRGCLWLFI